MKRLLLLAFLLPLCASAGSIYKSTGANGSRVYSDEPQANARNQQVIEFNEAPATPLPDSVLQYRKGLEERIRKRQTEAPPNDSPLLFTATWCGYCRRAKTWLGQQGIAYREYDIDTETGMSMLIQIGGSNSVPLLTWQGRKLRGYSAGSYAQFFGRSAE